MGHIPLTPLEIRTMINRTDRRGASSLQKRLVLHHVALTTDTSAGLTRAKEPGQRVVRFLSSLISCAIIFAAGLLFYLATP